MITPERKAQLDALIAQHKSAQTVTPTVPTGISPERKVQLDAIIAQHKTKTTPQAPVQPKSFWEQGADLVNKGFGAIGDVVNATGASKLVGGVIGTGGALIGGTVGAIGTPISNAIQGKPLFTNIKENIAKTASETAKFGYDIGKAGTEAAPLGAVGRIPGAVLGVTQGYQGVKNIGEAIKENDPVKGFQGATEIVGAGLGLKQAVGAKGLRIV